MLENNTRKRAKALFPTVLLTLLSIVQAFALELMWGHITEQSYLHTLSLASALGWLQISANLLGVLLIWLIYSDLVLRLSWAPTTTDAIFPFLVGILEFAQISSLGPANAGIWFVLLSILFAAMAWISQNTMRRARQEPDNRDFFDGVSPATVKDHLMSGIPAAVLLFIGTVLWLTGNQGWFAGLALLAMNGLLAFQMWLNHTYTQRSYAMGSS